MKNHFRRLLPDHETIRANRWLRPFANTLLHPRLWHLNRHSAAGAVAAGLFCGLIPGPFQMPSAALASVVFKVNLPLALITTLYSNPLTIVPLYLLAYGIGALLLGNGEAEFILPPEWGDEHFAAWLQALAYWAIDLGYPLLIGLLVLASGLALMGYFGVRAAWRIWLIRTWRKRQTARRLSLNQSSS